LPQTDGAWIDIVPEPDYTGNVTTLVDFVVGDWGAVAFEELPGAGVTKILSRSPYFVNIQPTTDFDRATMELRIWRGDVNDVPASASFALSKTIVQAGQPEIVFDIQTIVNDYVKNNIIAFGDQDAKTSSTNDSVWVKADIVAYFQGGTVGSTTRTYLAVDGFGYHTELYNPVISHKVLSTIDRHVFYAGSDYPLYFITEDLTSIEINGELVAFTFSQDYNNQVIAYLNIGAYLPDEGEYMVRFDYDGLGPIRHYFTVKTECRYQVVNCFFKNKFGFWQSIPFAKASRSKFETKSDKYVRAITSFGRYNLNQHGNRTFNKTQKQKISCNTDFIKENYNELFEEMMLSEFVYLEINGETLPVEYVENTFNWKTKLIDKIIQYNIEFEYSFNVMNTNK